MHLNELMVSVTGLVTPWSVSWPLIVLGAPFAKSTNLPLYSAVGYLATSSTSGPDTCALSLSCAKSMLAALTMTSTVPVFAAAKTGTVEVIVDAASIEFDTAGGLLERPAPGGKPAEMIDLEARMRMVRINRVGSRRAERGDADQRQDRGKLQFHQ